MKKFSFVLFAVVLTLCIAGAASAAPWKLAHIRPQDSPIHKDLTWLADELRKATDGRIDIQLYGNSQLGDYTVVQERVSLGAVEMSCESMSPSADKRLGALNMPYIVSDYAQARRNYGAGAKFSSYLADICEKNFDIKILAWWPMYFGGIGLTKVPVDPYDADAKQNCKVRVPTMKAYEALADALGYQATPLPFAEFFTAAQTGMVEGIFGGGAESYYSQFKDIIKCFIVANTHFEMWPLMINLEVYNSLSDADRAILDEKAREFEERRWAQAQIDQDYYVDLLKQAGAEIVRLSPEQLARFTEKGKAACIPAFKEMVGEAAYDEIMATIVP